MNNQPTADEILRQEIRKRLLTISEVDSHNFSIDVEDGVVRIRGDVPGRHAKRLTEACLADVPGIRNLENQLKIRRITRFSDNSTHGF